MGALTPEVGTPTCHLVKILENCMKMKRIGLKGDAPTRNLSFKRVTEGKYGILMSISGGQIH